MNFFTPASNDQSLVFLGQIFGSMNGLIPQPTPGVGGSTVGAIGDVTLLSTMFQTFNAVILVVGALIVAYTTVLAVLKTAQEGEFMGRQWNSLWIPLRMVLGIAALVPIPPGYSALQIVMMWVIIQGIGAADTLWNAVVNYVQGAGSGYAQLTVPSVGTNGTLGSLFQNVLCEQTAAYNGSNPGHLKGGNYYCAENSGDSFCTSGSGPLGPSGSYSFGPNTSNCGTINYCNYNQVCAAGNTNSIDCIVCQAQMSALSTAIGTLRNIAHQVVVADYTYRQFFALSHSGQTGDWGFVNAYCSANGISGNQCCVAPQVAPPPGAPPACTSGQTFPLDNDGTGQNPSPDAINNIIWPYGLQPSLGAVDFISVATSYYVNTISGAVSAYIAGQGQGGQGSPVSSNAFTAAMQLGWIYAGGFYYSIAGMNNAALSASSPTFTANPPSMDTTNPILGYRNNISTASGIVTAAANAAQGQPPPTGGTSSSSCPTNNSSSGINAEASILLKPGIDTVNQSSCFFSSTLGQSSTGSGTQYTTSQTSPNPLVALQHAGQGLLAGASALFLLVLGLAFFSGTVSSINGWVLGTGMSAPTEGGMILLWFLVVPGLFALISVLISLGALLAVYTPLVPYIVFTFGAIGWLLSTIEAMIAGPLVALGILMPGGSHDVLGRAEPALSLIFAIFLRPSLMIFGLVTGMLLASVVVYMINQMFWGTDFGVLHMITVGSGGSKAATYAFGGILEFILFLGAYVMLVVTALNKCFAAIHIIPDRVLGWIGIREAQGYGFETEGVSGTRSGAEAVAGQAGRAPGHVQDKASRLPGKKAGPAGNLGQDEGGGGGNQPP